MKNKLLIAGLSSLALLASTPPAHAIAPETELLLQLLQAKGVITADDASQFKKELTSLTDEKAEGEAPEHYHSIEGLSERVHKLEEAREEVAEGAAGRIQFGGRVEVEAGYGKLDSERPDEDSESSEVHLAKAELDVDAVLNQYISGHLAFLWEDEGEEPRVDIDEGIIALNGGDKMPLYCRAGKMVIPFGRYESHFITDPTTLTLGETNVGAIVVGYTNDLVDLSFGLFNGEVNARGDSGHDHADNYVASAVLTLPTDAAEIMAGASYTSNLAASKTLRDLRDDPATSAEVDRYVGAYSLFTEITFMERYNVIGEYVAAVKDFAIGDFDFNIPGSYTDNLKPSAWNVELAAKLFPKLEAALRIGGTNDFGDEELEQVYGAALLYNLFDSTSLTLEYLNGELQNKDDVNSATVQLAVEF